MRKSSFNLLVIIALFFSAIPCFAAQNIISSVIISQSKERPDGYELNIDSTKSSIYKTYKEDDGSVYFDLKNSTLDSNARTVYDDAQDIESVVVRQMDKNKVRIYVKGRYARNTEVVFLNAMLETAPAAKTVVINRPRSEYQPTTIQDDLENQDNIQDWDDNSFNFSHLLGTLLTNLKEGSSGIVLIILSVFAICAFIIKSLTTKLSQESEPLIGLNQNFNRNLEAKKEDIQTNSREEAMRQAQLELARAHQKYQDYLQNKYQTKPKAQEFKSASTDAVRKSIGLNQYQKSNQNPYLDQEVIKFSAIDAQTKETFTIPKKPQITRPIENRTFENTLSDNRNYDNINFENRTLDERTAETKKFTSPYIQRPNNNTANIPKRNINASNLRFLESVSKIYEKSGRGDLANELKNSMLKVKQTI